MIRPFPFKHTHNNLNQLFDALKNDNCSIICYFFIMINKEETICRESAIWDLHIHSCDCPKSSSDFQQLDINSFIELLDSIFQNYPDLKMISFTDHNHISKEVYEAANAKKWDITIIVGIEVDTYLDEEYKKNKDSKHVIYYFDPEKFVFDIHSEKINEKLKDGPV